MSTLYTIHFTDRVVGRAFPIQPYSTNGPANPSELTLASTSTSASTSLLLVGKGFPEYGEMVAENFVHLLEHFSNDSEPQYPISGQLWYNTAAFDGVLAPSLQVYNPIKHTLVPSPVAGFANIAIEGDVSPSYSVGGSVYVYDAGVGVRYQIISSIYDAPNTLIALTSTPSVSLVGRTVGGWDRVLQENNSYLTKNLDANGYTLINVVNPTDSQDVATKSYVDNIAAGSNSVASLVDTTVTSAIVGQLLSYDINGTWANKFPTAAGVLALSGGTMTGQLFLVGNPTVGTGAATKNYVDAQIIAANSISAIGDLTDVDITDPVPTNSMLQRLGANWINRTFGDWATLNGVALTTGVTMTGTLTLAADPTSGLEAATKDYVDNAIVASGNDEVVTGGFFDGSNQTLTLNRSAGLPILNLGGWGGLQLSAVGITYQVPDPRDESLRAQFLQHAARNSTQYPTIGLNHVIATLNDRLGFLTKPRDRAVFSADGLATVDLGSAGAYGDLKFDYVPAAASLQVYEDGIKRLASDHGWLRLAADAVVGSPGVGSPVISNTDELWQGFPTGLQNGVNYDFNIIVNDGAQSDSGTLNVVINGSSAQTLGKLIEEINAWADMNPTDFNGESTYLIAPFGVQMFDRVVVFYSSFPGAGSRVDISDGSGADPLFAAIAGDGNSYTYYINPTTVNDGERNDGTGTNPPVPSTRHYREIGRIGRASDVFEWETGSVPTAATTIEIISDHSMPYDQIIQP